MNGKYDSAALRQVNDYIAGARLDGDQQALGRFLATRAFLSMAADDHSEGEELLAAAAYHILLHTPRFDESNNLDARLVLLGLPDKAHLVRERMALPPQPSAELVTTTNLAVLLADYGELLPTPGRRTDVAAALKGANRPTLTRLIRADIARLERLGDRFYENPEHWYPVFAGLLTKMAAKVGLRFPAPQPCWG